MKKSKIAALLRGRVTFALACLLSLFSSVIWIEACKPAEKPTDGNPDISDNLPGITPQDLDPTVVPGFHFPENPEALQRWAVDPDSAYLMYRHGWGLWTAITAPSSESFQGEKLRVYETWLSAIDLVAAQDVTGGNAAKIKAQDPRPLDKLRQLQHQGLGPNDPHAHGGETVLGFVKYNPAAANHIMQYNLFNRGTLEAMRTEGKTEIPPFPADAVVLKVSYMQLDPDSIVDGRYYKIPAWVGENQGIKAYPVDEWTDVAWLDLENGSHGNTTQPRTAPRDEAATFNLDDFIYFRLNQKQAQRLTEESKTGGENITYEAGRYFVLTAFHIMTREFDQWTWQSFYWDAKPAEPQAPSSAAIAAEMPKDLYLAARHYSMTIAYSMLTTAQPLSGGNDQGAPVYCYNPYLEAPFNALDQPASKSWTYQGKTYSPRVGIEGNCMSCHAYASTPFDLQNDGTTQDPDINFTLYAPDRYVGMDDPALTGKLRCDFLWSIPLNSASVAAPAGKR